jgi:CMP-N-acetylneuraminic acid synthetase
MTTYYVIPARKGSRGFPNKNRKLFNDTFSKIPVKLHDKVIITTDDDYIIDLVKDTSVKVVKRSSELSGDKVSIKPVLQDVVKQVGLNDDDIIILLYLTYPERTWKQINLCKSFMLEMNGRSLLCGQDVKSHPHLCLYKSGFRGRQVIKHDLYRRQDYPEVFELSHYVGVCYVSELSNLNYNLYNDSTIYYHLNARVIDVDYESDLATE